jgi:hypothetical protein
MQIFPAENEFRIEDIIPNEAYNITITEKYFIKCPENLAYCYQKRGEK